MKPGSAVAFSKILLIGVIIMLSFFACGRQKYTVNFSKQSYDIARRY